LIATEIGDRILNNGSTTLHIASSTFIEMLEINTINLKRSAEEIDNLRKEENNEPFFKKIKEIIRVITTTKNTFNLGD